MVQVQVHARKWKLYGATQDTALVVFPSLLRSSIHG
jgi:hypothetical protein